MTRIHIFMAQVSGADISLPKNELGESNVQAALQVAFGVAGAIALLILTISALRYVISQGDPQSTAKAKNAILYALIGLLVCVFAVVIVRYVVDKI